MVEIKNPKEDKFLDKFAYQVTESGCWECTSHSAKDKDGYSLVYLGGKKKNLRLHRVSYRHYKGEIPEGYVVMHMCDNPSCFNPEHLEAGTHKDNVTDMFQKGRNFNGLRPRKLSEKQVKLIFEDSRSHEFISEDFGVTRSTVTMIKSGLIWSKVTGKVYNRKPSLDEHTVRGIFYAEGTYREIATRFGVASSCVSNIKNKKIFKKYLTEV